MVPSNIKKSKINITHILERCLVLSGQQQEDTVILKGKRKNATNNMLRKKEKLLHTDESLEFRVAQFSCGI